MDLRLVIPGAYGLLLHRAGEASRPAVELRGEPVNMAKHRQAAAFILAGGASSRMGQDKGLLEFGGVPLIVHTARLLEPLVASVTVVGPSERYAALGLSTVPDHAGAIRASKRTRRGPLAGIAAALAATRSPWNLIVACDLPYLSEEWLDWLLERAMHSPAQAVVPATERGLEPLAAVYRRECCRPIAAALARGERKVTDVLAELHVEAVERSEWRALDPGALVLKNMNTPGDYEEARKWRDIQRPREAERSKKVRPGRPLKAETGGAAIWHPSSRE
jgi:molybdenum cofactor guanylyltransferase